MKRIIMLTALALATSIGASTAEAKLPVPNVVCGGSCDGGGGVFAGGWCANPGAYSYTPEYRLVKCSPSHVWYYTL